MIHTLCSSPWIKSKDPYKAKHCTVTPTGTWESFDCIPMEKWVWVTKQFRQRSGCSAGGQRPFMGCLLYVTLQEEFPAMNFSIYSIAQHNACTRLKSTGEKWNINSVSIWREHIKSTLVLYDRKWDICRAGNLYSQLKGLMLEHKVTVEILNKLCSN